jgi:hypothetical protein
MCARPGQSMRRLRKGQLKRTCSMFCESQRLMLPRSVLYVVRGVTKPLICGLLLIWTSRSQLDTCNPVQQLNILPQAPQVMRDHTREALYVQRLANVYCDVVAKYAACLKLNRRESPPHSRLRCRENMAQRSVVSEAITSTYVSHRKPGAGLQSQARCTASDAAAVLQYSQASRSSRGRHCNVAAQAEAISIDDVVDAPDIADDLRSIQEKMGAEFEVQLRPTTKRCAVCGYVLRLCCAVQSTLPASSCVNVLLAPVLHPLAPSSLQKACCRCMTAVSCRATMCLYALTS